MPYNLLLLPLLGGFLLLHRIDAFRYRAQRLDGYRLLFESAFAGIALAALGRLLVVVTEGTALRNAIGPWWWRFAPFGYSDTAAIAFGIALLVPEIVNRIVSRSAAKDWAIRRNGDGLTRLLNNAELGNILVSLTMGNQKWYVGYVEQVPNLVPQDTYLRFYPVISGYRDKQTLRTVRTIFYDQLLHSNPDFDFSIVVPVAEIKSANLFDADVYEDLFADTPASTS